MPELFDTFEQWDAAIKTQSLHHKFDYQLVAMLDSHSNKTPRVQQDINNLLLFPDAKKQEIYNNLVEVGEILSCDDNAELLPAKDKTRVDAEYLHELNFYQAKLQRLQAICTLIPKEQEFREKGLVKRTPIGTTYYCDPSTVTGQLTGTWTFTNASATITAAADGAATTELAADDYVKVSSGTQWYKVSSVTDDDTVVLTRTFLETTVTDGVGATDYRDVSVAVGTSVANSYVVLPQFTVPARSAGDKLIVRRGKSERISEWADLAFTSDGTIVAPIIIETDYDNAWSDRVDLSVTGTATLAFGSKTVTFSADVSGVLAAGDWIYASGDATRDFAYEVATVATVTVTLFLPYKGNQAGAGKTMYNIKAAPIWNTAAGDYQVNLDGDNYWKFQGIHFRGTDVNGVFEIDGSAPTMFKDCIIEGNGASDYCLEVSDDCAWAKIQKCRFYNYVTGLSTLNGSGGFWAEVRDCLFDGNSVAISVGHTIMSWENILFIACEFKNHASGDLAYSTFDYPKRRAICRARNCLFTSTTEVDSHQSTSASDFYSEDHDGTLGDNRQLNFFSVAEATPSLQNDTTDVRAGGGATSIKVTPSANLDTDWEFSRVLLFEYPVYAVKDVAKTYTAYFKSDDDLDWDADPIATELWIEAEYWGHATNVARKILKSTGVCDNFNLDDTVWDTLTVTVTPLQTGVLYLRGYYCKTKEATNSNIFFCDTVIGVA